VLTVRVNRTRLLHEMACRGWHAADLARNAQLSEATVSHIMQGRLVSPATARKIAQALVRTPTVPGLDALIDADAA
jgi:transcriptional regulator with XRE-family HTH domain